MLTIRLQRGGKRNAPQYKVVLAEKTAANQKQFVEVLGAYNPHSKELTIRSQDRLNYWMNEQRVELSATVHNLFVTKELVKADKKHAFAVPKKEVPAEEAPAAEATVETGAESTEAPAEPAPDEAAAPAVEEAPAEPAPAAEPAAEESESKAE